jgi:hypothetical protein
VRRPVRAAHLALITIAAAGVIAACGVPLQSSAERLPSNAIPSPLRIPTPAASPTPSPSPPASPSPSPTPTTTPEPTPAQLRLWFVQEDGLAAVESDLPVGASPDVIVQSLAIGPTEGQVLEGLRTVARDPLTGLALVSVAPPEFVAATPILSSPPSAATGPPRVDPSAAPASVTVALSPAFTALPPAEQVLLLGQVVLSLTGSGERSVAFTDEVGTPLAVPLPDGRLLDVPATVRDYNALIIRP